MQSRCDETVFESSLISSYPQLLRFAERLSGSRAEAQDLVQDTIERGLRYRALFREGDAPDRWLATILRRLFLDRCRRVRLAGRVSHQLVVEEIPESEAPAGPRPWETFGIEDVRRALLFLDPSFREPYTMFAFDHLSYGEIGERLSLPAGTIASRVYRARQKLRELLESGAFRLRQVSWPAPAAAAQLDPRARRRLPKRRPASSPAVAAATAAAV